MHTFLKTTAALFSVGALMVFAFYSAYIAGHIVTSQPDWGSITHHANNSSRMLVKKQGKVIQKSRESTVRILSASPDHHMASQSGTYVTLFGRYFVITTRHGILGDCLFTKIYIEQDMFDCERFIELNDEADYALIEIQKIPGLNPIKIPRDIAMNQREWDRDLSVMNRVFYTGFPNSVGPLTIGGHVAGYTLDEHIYIISYAWSGSSGSGVFSQDGRYLGYILAVDVGEGITGAPAVLENVVLVVPAFKINWASVLDMTPAEVPEPTDTANYSTQP